MLLERVRRVVAQTRLGVLVRLLGALRRLGALVVDVGGGDILLLSTSLVLGLGGLATGVGGRHCELVNR